MSDTLPPLPDDDEHGRLSYQAELLTSRMPDMRRPLPDSHVDAEEVKRLAVALADAKAACGIPTGELYRGIARSQYEEAARKLFAAIDSLAAATPTVTPAQWDFLAGVQKLLDEGQQRRKARADRLAAAVAEPVALQGGLDNEDLRSAWAKKLPGVAPTERDLSAFAVGVEVGSAHFRNLEPVARIRCWTKPSRFTGEDEGHAELSDWEDGIEALPDGEHLLYAAPAAPPQREPLTEAQAERLYQNIKPSQQQDARSCAAFKRLVRVVEAAHGISAININTIDGLRRRVRELELAEEGAKEAFGVIVQEKHDLAAECLRLRALLESAHAIIWRSSAPKEAP